MDYTKIIEIVKSAKKFVLRDDLSHEVRMKGEADFVTGVDLSISEYIKEKLHEIAPEIGFMSEEEEPGKLAPRRWILDPVDGTTNLVFDYRMSSISLGLCDGGKSVFGVVYNPYTDEIFTAVRGEGAYLNGKRLSVVDREPHNSLVEFGAGSTRKHEADEAFRIGKEVFMHCLDLRRICSSALAICFIAAGRSNGYFEKVIKPWDYAAASLILEEAGGSLCDWTGAPLPFDRPSGIIAGSPKTYEYLKSVLLKQSV